MGVRLYLAFQKGHEVCDRATEGDSSTADSGLIAGARDGRVTRTQPSGREATAGTEVGRHGGGGSPRQTGGGGAWRGVESASGRVCYKGGAREAVLGAYRREGHRLLRESSCWTEDAMRVEEKEQAIVPKKTENVWMQEKRFAGDGSSEKVKDGGHS